MLTSTMLGMKEIVELIQSSSLRNEVRVVVGGAPVSEKFAQEISASLFARDASEDVEFMRELYP